MVNLTEYSAMYVIKPIGPLICLDKIRFLAPQDVREADCKGPVKPILEYGNSVGGGWGGGGRGWGSL